MGQAFDGDGRVLGEASGATKREVLDALERAHPDAAEIRIKAAEEQAQGLMTVDAAQLLTGEAMLAYFKYEHLPVNLQAISCPFGRLAIKVATSYPRNPERTVTLRKLLEAKDAAVRCNLP